MGSAAGNLKASAKRVGVSVDDYASLIAQGLKFCWRCRRWRQRDCFGIDSTRADGRFSSCQECRKPPRQLRLIRETTAEGQRRRYATDADYRHRTRQYVHARKRSVPPITVETMRSRSAEFSGLCAYCPAPATGWDHVVPVSKGGSSERSNIVPACASCNSRKGNRAVLGFIVRYGIAVSDQLRAALVGAGVLEA